MKKYAVILVLLLIGCSKPDHWQQQPVKLPIFLKMDKTDTIVKYNKTPFKGYVQFTGTTNIPDGTYDAEQTNRTGGMPSINVNKLLIVSGKVYLKVNYIVNISNYNLDISVNSYIPEYQKGVSASIKFVKE